MTLVDFIQLNRFTVILCVLVAECRLSAVKVYQPMARIGIFSGSFDPIHIGHIAFALQAIDRANLDKVYIAPERKPPRKPGITHPHHRFEMIKLAIRGHDKIELLELLGNNFTPAKTLPRLKKKFKKDKLFLLMGSDLFEHMHNWPDVEILLKEVGLVIGARGNYEVTESLATAHNLPAQPRELTILDSIERDISSKQIRQQLRNNHRSDGVVDSVENYAKKHWLYDRVKS